MAFSRIAKTLWAHKKKSFFLLVATAYGTSALKARLRDDQTRQGFAEQARQYGLMGFGPTQRLHRVTVLVNREAGGRRAADRFKRNALPLLNLAGLEVNVVEVSSALEMESLCRVMNNSEADCIYLVGGDGTLSRALVGFSQNGAPFPIGLFPGGRKNLAFKNIFEQRRPMLVNGDGKTSVQIFCESAMALIEGQTRFVYPAKCTISKETDDSPIEGQTVTAPDTYWLLSNLYAGWFEHCEQKAPKLWWWGPLRYHFVYFWEFFKRKPTPLDLRISYQEFCPGCNRCMVPVKRNNLPNFWSLFTRFLGSSFVEKTKSKMDSDFALVENPSCGQTKGASVSGADIRVDIGQTANGSKLRLRVGGEGDAFGRWAAMCYGWNSLRKTKRTDKKTKGRDEDENGGQKAEERDDVFYALDIEADRLELQFTHIPVLDKEFVQKLSLAGEWGEFEQYGSKKIVLETTKKMTQENPSFPLHFYIPKLPLL